MKTTTRQAQIRKNVLSFFGGKRKRFTTSQLLEFVQKRIKTDYVMPDTITRVMRELRSRGFINYECPAKAKMEYFITKNANAN